LTEDEFEEMKRHTTYGREALEMAQVDIEDRDFMATVIAIVAYHHERWDGTGYPERLEREAIPIEARFMALADVYDALTTARACTSPLSRTMRPYGLSARGGVRSSIPTW
jgi:putative two-component system response regulator